MQTMQDSCIPWLGSVPNHWNRGKLKQYIFEISEKNTPVKTTDILSLTNKLGVVPYEEKGNQGNTAKEKYDEYKLAYPDTIVANSMNILIGSVGYCSYFGCVSPVYYVFKNFKNGNLRYINYVFQTTEFQKCLRQFSNGILEIRQRVSAKTILNQDFFFPTLDEQNMIVEYLDTKCAQIDTIIAKAQSVIEKLQEYKRAIITNAVVKGLDLTVEMADSGIEWIDSIPNHWKINRLIFSAYIRARLGWKGLKADEYTSEGHPFLSAVNIQNDKLVWEDLNFINDNRYDESPEIKLELGDLLLVKDGAGIGKCAIVDQLPYGTATTNSSLGVITPYSELNSMYLYYFFESAIFQNYISRIKNGMGVPHLTQGNLKNIMVVIPPYCEQDAIVAYLDDKCSNLDSIILKKQTLIDKLIEYKKSLIYEVVTGKKEVPHV
jgi:type I restriction modification DNA specificity domain protein